MSSSKLLGAIDLLEGRHVIQKNLGNPWMESSPVDKVLGITKLGTTWPCALAAQKPPGSGAASPAVWTAGEGEDSAPLLNSLPSEQWSTAALAPLQLDAGALGQISLLTSSGLAAMPPPYTGLSRSSKQSAVMLMDRDGLLDNAFFHLPCYVEEYVTEVTTKPR